MGMHSKIDQDAVECPMFVQVHPSIVISSMRRGGRASRSEANIVNRAVLHQFKKKEREKETAYSLVYINDLDS